MSGMKRIIESIPNFSEGRDLDKIDKIINSFRETENVKLLDYQRDEDHNRMVVTAIGEPVALKHAIIKAMGVAIDLIDMRKHKGQHPRMGAIDVVPFVPVKNITMTEAIEFSKEIAKEVASKYGLPVFLYEESATVSQRRNLATIRKGQFEGMVEKMKAPEWKPDFGPGKIHPSAGVTAIGARMPLVAFNVNLKTDDMKVADAIAKSVRHISGGLRYCKAIGIALKERGIVQVSMNMTDYTKTSLYRSFELVRTEAKRYGVNVIGSEIVGLVPMEALIDTAVYYMGIEKFTTEQVLESRIWE